MSASGAPGSAGAASAAGAPISNAGSPVVGGGASSFGAGAGGMSAGAGGFVSSFSGAGGAAAGAVSSPGGASDPCATVKCGTGQTCSNGTCMCTSGKLCTDGCFDTQNDQNHCGDCSTKCAADGACVSGKCVNPTCNPDTQQRSGHITTYQLATSLVACHYPTNTLPQYYGAMNEYDWNNSGVCGACVEITNTQNQKKLVVQITDECPYKGNEQWCFQGSHHIDLNSNAYGALGANNNPATTWKYVACTSSGNLKYYFDTASQQYYLAVTPMNAKNLVSKMEVMTKDGYVALTHTNYNTYELKTGAGTGALTFRLTDIYNHVITDTVTLSAGQVVQGNKQFAACP
jgi:expansin (peptidoglycan-binding protein)